MAAARPITIALLGGLLYGAQETRLAVPDPGAQKEAEKLIHDIFKDDFAKKAPGDRSRLSRKLLLQAAETKDDPVVRYVLLGQAEDLAVQIGDVEFALSAIDESAKLYQIDGPVRKESALLRISGSMHPPEEVPKLAAAWFHLAQQWVPLGEFEHAEKAAQAAAPQYRKAKDVSGVARTEVLEKEIADLKVRYKGLGQARETLRTNANDGLSNSLVGRFNCFVRGDWQAGLGQLAQGSDLALKALASAELKDPSEPTDAVSVADGWYALAEKETGRGRLSLLRHCAMGYRRAAIGLSGLSKVRIEKRLEELRRSIGTADDVDLIKLIDIQRDTAEGQWSLSGSVLCSLKIPSTLTIPYVPPDEYDLGLIIERKDGKNGFLIGVVAGGRQVSLVLDEEGNHAGLSRIDGLPVAQNGTLYEGILLPKDKETSVSCQIRKEGVTLTVNGTKILDWTGDLQRLSRNPDIPVSRSDTLYLVGNNYMRIKQFGLVPVSGQGKALR